MFQNLSLGELYFPAKATLFSPFQNILEENCGTDIINGTFKCKLFIDKCSKTCRLMSYTFPQKPRSFNRFSILEENCVADIINRTFKCETFVDKCCKKRSLEWVILSYKSQVLSSFSAF